MATPSTLAPVRPVGGHIEPRENIFETTAEYAMNALFGTPFPPENQTNQGPVRPSELSQTIVETGFDFRKPRSKAEVHPELRQGQLERARNQVAVSQTVEQKRAYINRGNELHEAYEGSVDKEGNVTVYHEAQAERRNSELEEDDLNKKRQLQVVQATGQVNHATNKNSQAERGGGQVTVFDSPA